MKQQITYRNHTISFEQCGHPQAMNVLIDGKTATVAYFPADGERLGKTLIDARIEAREALEREHLRVQGAIDFNG